jgi:alpha-1,2-mannosyltransferase
MDWLRFQQRKRWIAGAFLLAMTCCNLALAVRLLPSLRNGYQDFTIYYTGAKLLLEGKPVALYNLDAQYQIQLQFAQVPIRKGALPYNHPPFEALLFVPLAYFNYWPAYLLWTVLNLIMLAASLAMLRRFPTIRQLRPLLLGLGSVAFFPVAVAFIQGQDTILLLLLLVLGLIFLDRGADAAAGAWLAAGLFRPHMVLPMILLLVSKRPRMLFGVVPVAVALAGVWVAMTGWAGPIAYVRFVLWMERSSAGGFGSQAVPNLRGIVDTLFRSQAASALPGLLTILLSVVVFALAWRRIRRRNDSASYSFCLASVVALLVSYHALAHDVTMLLPLVLFLLGAAIAEVPRDAGGAPLPLLVLLFLAPLYIGLLFRANSFFWFGFVALWLFFRLLRMPAPAAEPA